MGMMLWIWILIKINYRIFFIIIFYRKVYLCNIKKNIKIEIYYLVVKKILIYHKNEQMIKKKSFY